ncbi:MAG TPA: PfkB family carbohydrate kinase [Solirubrobacter sp.]|nr:PfkB family carbohydrate kinase [Solirubrobacter sp.]
MTPVARRNREAFRPSKSAKRFAVVGHVEWIEFGVFSHVPTPGEIIEAREWFSEAAGSAAVVAVQLAKLSGDVDFFTALGDDERGRRAKERLTELGVRVHAAGRDAMQRWAFVHLDDDGERTISVLGERHAPHGDDDLPWERLDGADAVFVSGADHAAMEQARRAKLLVATPRALDTMQGIRIDALIGSGKDRLEQVDPDTLDPPPALVITTAGKEGGTWQAGEQRRGSFKAAELPGLLVDAYGAGDTFAGGATYALGAGYEIDDALAFAARAGAANLTGRGPYAGQLTAADL